MFSSTYNGEYEDVKAVHDGVGGAHAAISPARVASMQSASVASGVAHHLSRQQLMFMRPRKYPSAAELS